MATPAPKPAKGDYTSLAAQYARAKALKDGEEAARKRDDAFVQGVLENHGISSDKLKERNSKSKTNKGLGDVELTKVVETINKRKEKEFKRAWGWVAGFFALILSLHISGLYFFTKGFLLTRLVLDEKSKCGEPPIDILRTWNGIGTPKGGCWHPKTFSKAVVVIIDALRYDFTVPFNTESGQPKQAFHDALPFLYETAVTKPENAFLLPFIADPPTTTLQRLKGLTTGTLPTFIDAGSNFAGTAIEEDNLLMQMRDAGMRMVHLGDDTWTALFPGYFEEGLSRAYDSFNVWDLHTVDDGVTEHVIPLLKAGNRHTGSQSSKDDKKGEWDIIFAHYLGVDHAGHRYGPDHPAMTAKLQQMDGVVRNLTREIDDDTLLVIMGDHGMDSKGDHGGESDDEVEAALWMYSKKGVFGKSSGVISGKKSNYLPPPLSSRDRKRAVNQIDLVPTLALLLGLPIPFNNLGNPIYEAFNTAKNGHDWRTLTKVTRIAGAGVKRYMDAYYKARGLEVDKSIGQPHNLWSTIETTTLGSKDRKPDSGGGWIKGLETEVSWKQGYRLFTDYLSTTLSVCRGLWARFDVPNMIYGILIFAGSVIVLVIYASSVVDEDAAVEDPELERKERQLEVEKLTKGEKIEEAEENDLTYLIVKRALIGVAAGCAASSGAWTLKNPGSLLDGFIFRGAFGALAGCFYAFIEKKQEISFSRPTTFWGWLALIFTVSQSIGFASNSYTIWEDSISLFFISTFGLATTISSLRQSDLTNRALGAYHSILFIVLGWGASFSRLCREEQMPYCRSTYYASATSSTSAPWQLIIPFALALLLPEIIKSYYNGTKSYHGFAPMWISIALRLGLFLNAVFWTMDAADDGDWAPSVPKELLKGTRVVIARTVFGMSLVAGTIAFAWAMPCVSVSTTTASVPSQPSQPSLATSTAEEIEGKEAHFTTAAPTTNAAPQTRLQILGYANTHGTHYLLFPISILLALLLVQKPMGAGSLALMFWQLLSLLEIIDTNSLTHSPIGPIMIALLGSFHFFKTGHQATLSSIQWESAFIPLHTVTYPWSPVLVAANTFGPQILAAICVPLVVLWKQVAKQKGILRLGRVARSLAWFLLYFSFVAVCTMCWAGHLRRHLMLYRIFSPRFMMGGLVVLVVEVVGILGALVGVRSSGISVGEVFGWS